MECGVVTLDRCRRASRVRPLDALDSRWTVARCVRTLHTTKSGRSGSATNGKERILFNLSLELRKNAFASAMVFISFAATAYGQGFGTIVGTVTDSSGAVVPAATVRIIQTGTQLARSVATNAQGYFVVPSLQPSQYDVDISAPGFRSSYQKNVTLQADQSLTMNATLEIGAPSEIITVSG